MNPSYQRRLILLKKRDGSFLVVKSKAPFVTSFIPRQLRAMKYGD